MKEEVCRLWDIIFKGLGFLVLAVGGIVGIRNYLITTQEQTRKVSEPFLAARLRLYLDASKSAATLASSTVAEELTSARERFFQLYWGELSIVEDKTVEAAMVDFKTALEAYDQKRASRKHLQDTSLYLAHVCRDSLRATGGVANSQIGEVNPTERPPSLGAGGE